MMEEMIDPGQGVPQQENPPGAAQGSLCCSRRILLLQQQNPPGAAGGSSGCSRRILLLQHEDPPAGTGVISCDEFEEKNGICPICCKGIPPACSDDEIHCEPGKNLQFNGFYTLLIVLGIFIFGIPLLI